MKHPKVFKTCLAILALNICTLHAETKIQGKKDGSGTVRPLPISSPRHRSG